MEGILQSRLQLKIEKGKRSKRIRNAYQQLALYNSLSHEDFDAAEILMRLATEPAPSISPSLSHSEIGNKPNKRKRIRTVKLRESTDLELVDFDESKIERPYSCKTCSRKFASFQALGGHRASCFNKLRSSNGGLDMQEEEEQGTEELDFHEQEEDPAYFQSFHGSKGMGTEEDVKKAKVHKCPVCYRVFSCGQALGGHKRCHNTCVSTVEAASSLSSIEQQEIRPVKTVCLLDLNMPAPIDADDEEQDSNGSCFQLVTYTFPDHCNQKFGVSPFETRPEWGSMESNKSMFHPDDEAHSNMRFTQLQDSLQEKML